MKKKISCNSKVSIRDLISIINKMTINGYSRGQILHILDISNNVFNKAIVNFSKSELSGIVLGIEKNQYWKDEDEMIFLVPKFKELSLSEKEIYISINNNKKQDKDVVGLLD